MPSQIAHLLCALDSIDPQGRHLISRDEHYPWLALGAQGPDLFYHSQRRRPTAIQYGTLMHRHGYGAVTAGIIDWARENNLVPEDTVGTYVAAFISHAILDRHTHPYINYRSGRFIPGQAETARYRTMHAFLERLIDVALLQELRNQHPNALDFFGIIQPVFSSEDSWTGMIMTALTEAYPRAATDHRLAARLHNAWQDAFGYYEFTRYVDATHLEEALRREEAGRIRRGWLSVVHPPNVPSDLDVLNQEHRLWLHPCSSKRESHAGFLDMYNAAVRESAETVKRVFHLWKDGAESAEIAAVVGDHNLSDGRQRKRPCRPRHMDPLPLPELQDRIRDSIRRGSGGLVS